MTITSFGRFGLGLFDIDVQLQLPAMGVSRRNMKGCLHEELSHQCSQEVQVCTFKFVRKFTGCVKGVCWQSVCLVHAREGHTGERAAQTPQGCV
jgi:hypothetical protein